MSKYRACELEEHAKSFDKSSRAFDVYMLCASLLRQNEAEEARNPAVDPRPGDRVELADGGCVVFNDHEAKAHELREWEDWCAKPGATIVRRREVQQ